MKIIIKMLNLYNGGEDGVDGFMNGEEVNVEYFMVLISEFFSLKELVLFVD